MAKQTYTVKVALIHERKIYQPDDSITINDDKLATTLLKRGQIVAPRAVSLPPAAPQQQQQPPPTAPQQEQPPADNRATPLKPTPKAA